MTYDELNRRANQIAHYLISSGVGPDVLVANVYFPKGSGTQRDNSRVPYKLAFTEHVFDVVNAARRSATAEPARLRQGWAGCEASTSPRSSRGCEAAGPDGP